MSHFVIAFKRGMTVIVVVYSQVLPASSSVGDSFGTSVCLSGLWLVCGAPVADTDGSEDNGAYSSIHDNIFSIF